MPPASVTSIRADAPRGAIRAFANPDVLLRSWYAAGTSRSLGRREVRSVSLAGHRLVLWRGASGRVHAAESRCPHLGADLGHGEVLGEELRCALHHYCYRPDGALASAPGLAELPERRLRTVAVEERWGRLWAYLGGSPDFELPGPHDRDPGVRVLRLPPQRFGCHPHLIAVNAFDTAHIGPLHDVELLSAGELLRPTPQRLDLDIVARFRSPRRRALTGGNRGDIRARLSVLGGNLSFVHVESPIPFEVLFAGQPLEGGGARTDTTVFLQRGTGVRGGIQVAALLVALLHRDHEMLDDTRFLRGFTAADEVFRQVVEAIDRMPVV